MKTITLRRKPSTDEGTQGALFDGDRRICFTMELPWRDNHNGESCIPPGKYRVDYMAASGSGKYQDVYHVQGVPGRSEILIHPANFAGDVTKGFKSELLGCIAPARHIGRLVPPGKKLQLAGIGSKLALGDLHAVTGRQSFLLEVIAP